MNKNPYADSQMPFQGHEAEFIPNAAAENLAQNDDALLESYRQRLCGSCNTKTEAEEIRLRALAEMENFKKRLQKEKDEALRFAAEPVLADLLPGLDNLDLAIQYGSQDEACKSTIMGVELTRKALLEALKNHGLESIGEQGQAFDPEMHEAIGQEESLDMAEGHILQVLQRGYKLKGRLLRPAKVVVSLKPSPKHLNVKV